MYYLQFYSYAQSIGSSFIWIVPDYDMPDYPSDRGYLEFRDKITTPSGNTFIYDKSKVKHWTLNFADITELSKNKLQHICNGWLGQKQITMVFFGTSANGDDYEAAEGDGQLWGTGFVSQLGEPKEKGIDLWDYTIEITEFGANQIFT